MQLTISADDDRVVSVDVSTPFGIPLLCLLHPHTREQRLPLPFSGPPPSRTSQVVFEVQTWGRAACRWTEKTPCRR